LIILARNFRPHLLWLGIAFAMLLLSGIALLASVPSPASAAKGGTCEGFKVTTGGQDLFRRPGQDHPRRPGG
jgi:hypothetical protein